MRLKVLRRIFSKNWSILGQYFPKSKKSGDFKALEYIGPWSYMKKQLKTLLKCVFVENISDFDPF